MISTLANLAAEHVADCSQCQGAEPRQLAAALAVALEHCAVTWRHSGSPKPNAATLVHVAGSALYLCDKTSTAAPYASELRAPMACFCSWVAPKVQSLTFAELERTIAAELGEHGQLNGILPGVFAVAAHEPMLRATAAAGELRELADSAPGDIMRDVIDDALKVTAKGGEPYKLSPAERGQLSGDIQKHAKLLAKALPAWPSSVADVTRTREGMLLWSAVAADYISALPGGGPVADGLRRLAAKEVSQVPLDGMSAPTPTRMWKVWWRPAPPRGYRSRSGVLMRLASAVLAGVTWPAIQRARKPARSPALPLDTGREVSAVLATRSAKQVDGEQLSLLTYQGDIALRTKGLKITAGRVAMIGQAAGRYLLEKAPAVLGTVYAHRVVRFLLQRVADQHFAGVDNPQRVDIVGGWAKLADVAGVPKKRRQEVKPILEMLSILDFHQPGWKSYGLVHVQEQLAAPGRKALLIVTMALPCLPGWTAGNQSRKRGAKRLTPFLREPCRYVGRRNEHAGQWGLMQRLAQHMAERPAELTHNNGAVVKLNLLRRYASDHGLSWPTARKMVANFCDATQGPVMLTKRGDVLSLGEFYAPELAVLREGAGLVSKAKKRRARRKKPA